MRDNVRQLAAPESSESTQSVQEQCFTELPTTWRKLDITEELSVIRELSFRPILSPGGNSSEPT
jgi:hypothetical protein